MSPTIATYWEKFERTVLDTVRAGAVQRKESRRVFYAGAEAMFQLMLKATEPHDEALCLMMIDELRHELDRFGADLQRGKV